VTGDHDIGWGEEPTPADLRAAAVTADLTGTSALLRIAGNARATVGTVTVVGTVLSGLGLLTLQQLQVDDLTWKLALGAAAAGVASVISGLLYLALRLERLNVDDVLAVDRWYRRQMNRVWLVVAASWLLIGALVLACAAAAQSVLGTPRAAQPALSLQLSGTGEDRALGAEVSVANLDPGEVVTTRVVGVGAGSCAEDVLLQGSSRADRSGTASAAGTVEKLGCHETFQLVVLRAGQELAEVAVP
jgi:hypothetical protein